MPLPAENAIWPPLDRAPVTHAMARWSAWYSGDPAELAAAYGNNIATGDSPRFASTAPRVNGLRRLLQRFWWGRPVRFGESQRDMIHVPIASDICQASADLLFSDPPKFTIPSTGDDSDGKPIKDSTTQDRLDTLLGDGFFATLAEGAELAAALGGIYLRVAWDKNIEPDAPFTTVIHADAAIPTFQWGRLTEVTFWTIVARDPNGAAWWRHLEQHSVVDGVGVIEHGLYQGNQENIGQRQPLTARPETAMLTDLVSTETPGLAVEYIPNQRPQRKWRSLPAGVNLGRSDLDGVEGLMDALDEVFASWMRDIRLAKGRLVVSRDMLHDLGPGQGQAFDAEQEIYQGLNAPADAKMGEAIQLVQFDIRVAEHQQSAQSLIEQILRTAGYSSQTFGEGSDAARIQTATEVESRERRSLLTRDRKLRHWRPGLASHIQKLLAVDAALFASGVTPVRPVVDFAAAVQETQLALAQTAFQLEQANAASMRTRVEMVHPDWDDDQIDAEVALIKSEAPTLPDPTAFDPGATGDGFGDQGDPADPAAADPNDDSTGSGTAS